MALQHLKLLNLDQLFLIIYVNILLLYELRVMEKGDSIKQPRLCGTICRTNFEMSVNVFKRNLKTHFFRQAFLIF
jgi:hypothetical protein